MLSSHFHAVVVSVGTIAVLIFYPEFISQPITFWNSAGANVLKFSVGYFAYDLLVTIRSTIHSRNMQTFYIVHHAIGGAALTYVLAHKRCAGTALQCLLMEVNSVVTQRRSALLYCGKHNTKEYVIVKYTNILTIILFRLCWQLKTMNAIWHLPVKQYSAPDAKVALGICGVFLFLNSGILTFVIRSDLIVHGSVKKDLQILCS